MLAKLRKPALLLEKQTLQVVVKAQKIIAPAKAGGGGETERAGLWRAGGQHENEAAAVLFYYGAGPPLQGGNMEFAARAPFDAIGSGVVTMRGLSTVQV